MAGKYLYTPLNEQALQIRLLVIPPGEPEDRLEVLLYTRSSSQDVTLSYEAVSYAWGSTENLVGISVTTASHGDIEQLFSQDSTHPFEHHDNEVSTSYVKPAKVKNTLKTSNQREVLVTQNLSRALPYLRLRYRPRVLWIDALCVNQSDLLERSSQVERMADIYQGASNVIVWLGEEDHDSIVAMDFLDEVRSRLYYDEAMRKVVVTSRGVDDAHSMWGEDYTPGVDIITIRSYISFWSRPWFQRLWVRQEVYFGGDPTIVLCGHRQIRWQRLREAFIVVRIKGLNYTWKSEDPPVKFAEISGAYARVTNHISSLFYGASSMRFEHGVQSTRSTHCCDPRDRVFALLSLLYPPLPMRPDYTKSIEQTFHDATLALIHSRLTLQHLMLCELSTKLDSVPSWVPNLSAPKLAKGLQYYGPYGCLESVPRTVDNILYVSGRYIATIKETYVCSNLQCSMLDNPTEVHSQEFLRLLALVDIDEQPQRQRDFVSTLICDDVAENYLPPREDRPSTLMIDIVCSWLGTSSKNDISIPVPIKLDTSYGLYMRRWTEGRSLIVDDAGQFGLCPASSKSGDIIAYLVGCKVPMTLRPQHDGTYLVVGDAYHHGFMYGEALLGPLPDGLQVVRKHNEYPVFLHRQTGEVRVGDPRLGSCPDGWRQARTEYEDDFLTFVEESTGISRDSNIYDPRTFPAEIERRGIKLQEFKLA